MSKTESLHCRHLDRQGLTITTVDRQRHREFHLTLLPLPWEKPAEIVRRLALALKDREASVVRHEVFGAVAAQPEIISALKREFGRFDWPVMWIEGQPCIGQLISGMHIFAVAETKVDTLDLDGLPIARIYNDGYMCHCLLGDVKPLNLSASTTEQSRELFERLERALSNAGMSLTDVVRTWFFLDDILDWYGIFNLARNDFYRSKNLFQNLMPASTGVGGRNPSSAAVVAGAWAVKKISNQLRVCEVLSPLQNSPVEYGSAFSRAVLMAAPDSRRLLLSGTASIGQSGQSVHQGNVREQIALTMEVVRQILYSNGFNYSNVTRATAYFKDSGGASVFKAWREEQNIEAVPLLVTQADICRDELLFEVELDAVH
jgi:enamine deaminase RidA (YjgF/YER057c/UK114 family)